jgi:ATP adenylyltransferase/5',5'''-P-1,P-4-tetraphosphate phosphorylase II
LAEEYSQYLKDQLNYCMDQVGNSHSTQSYNFFMGKNWMLVVLRKKEKIFDVVSLNALGVLGSIFVKNEQYKEICIKKLPSDILKEILVPIDDLDLYKMKF